MNEINAAAIENAGWPRVKKMIQWQVQTLVHNNRQEQNNFQGCDVLKMLTVMPVVKDSTKGKLKDRQPKNKADGMKK
jgi:hypothetical protein